MILLAYHCKHIIPCYLLFKNTEMTGLLFGQTTLGCKKGIVIQKYTHTHKNTLHNDSTKETACLKSYKSIALKLVEDNYAWSSLNMERTGTVYDF